MSIDIDRAAGTITVTDNGIGMTPPDLNERFLYVGYRRRGGWSPGRALR